MKIFGSILGGSAIALALAGGAQSADLPTTKAPAAPPPTHSCFASFYDYFNASAQDCPLTYMGITAYGVIDVGGGWAEHASKFNPSYNNGVFSVISKTNQGAAFQLVPNGLSQSNIGIKGREEFAPGWAFVFDANTSFDPYSLQLSNGPRSLVENNNTPLIGQNTNSDSSRAGQWDNTRGYLGISSSTFGTLTAGRETALSNDLVTVYDPMGGSYAFSLIGFSSSLASGLGDTETSRYNTSVKYQVAYNNFRAAAAWQFGGYEQGNGSDGAYQFDLGADYAGFSVDAVYSYAKDAVSLGTYSFGALPKGATVDDLKATLADINAGIIGLKYVNGPFKAFGGYEYARYSNPTDSYAANAVANGFSTLGGYDVLPGAANVSITSYSNNKILQVAWLGATYSIRPDLDITGAYYYAEQNNFFPSTVITPTARAAACAPNTTKPSAATGFQQLQGATNTYCAGHENAESALLDWRPFKRLDVYAGVMFSQVTGGLASGFFHTTNIAPTAGLRLTF
ncbi:porin [Methylocapsa sp. S129]|uniref:porin n=1 Tax=Methylocapsa sp. S129 TaxID=1641869 RepID=UPI00131C87EA|nr:porin [Methylocapsa sp. S129]